MVLAHIAWGGDVMMSRNSVMSCETAVSLPGLEEGGGGFMKWLPPPFLLQQLPGWHLSSAELRQNSERYAVFGSLPRLSQEATATSEVPKEEEGTVANSSLRCAPPFRRVAPRT